VGERTIAPGVPGLAADAVELAARGHGSTVTQIIGDDRRVLVQRRGVTPGHEAPPARVPTRIVTRSPMALDSTVADVSGLYPNGV
jgi:hypothetical protein